MKGRAIIIGAGPAGLTAAYELCKRSAISPVVLEKSEFMGGIARTVNYHGNRIDIGGHRFFSKSDRVMNWWLDILPLEGAVGPQKINYQQRERWLTNAPARPNATNSDQVMLVRRRKSRIYFLRRFFDYPIRMNSETIRKLGLWRVFKIAVSYLRAVCFPIRNEQNLEEFLINRFGRQLYLTFFKSYTEKVWGVPGTGQQRRVRLALRRVQRDFSGSLGDVRRQQYLCDSAPAEQRPVRAPKHPEQREQSVGGIQRTAEPASFAGYGAP